MESLNDKLARKKELEKEQFRMMKDLYGHYRNGSFLSIDIVGSTRLKEGEDSIRVVQTFQSFHRYINENIYGSLGSVFSGDGVMALFERAQDAVNAGVRIYQGLEEFNRRESKLKRYLNVRIGINSGTLLVDDAMDLGRMTERNIDIAGHLQKYGAPGQILISAFTREQIKNKDDFIKRWRTIDNTVVYQSRVNYTPLSQLSGTDRFRGWLAITMDNLRQRSAGPGLLLKKVSGFAVIGILVVLIAAVVYFNWEPGGVSRSRDVPIIKKNRVENMRADTHLGDAVMWKKGKLVEIPDKVYLIIPKGKNTSKNRGRKIQENTVLTLRRGGDRKFYLDKNMPLLDKLGLFDTYVETQNDYLIFFNKADADSYLKKKRR